MLPIQHLLVLQNSQTIRKCVRGFFRTTTCNDIHPSDLVKLFHEKADEYRNKSSGGKMVEPTPEILAQLDKDIKLAAKEFGAKEPSELEKFPEFTFDPPKIDPIFGEIEKEPPKKKG